MKATITVGVSGSGKSTWAEEDADGVVINRDSTRWKVSGVTGWANYKFGKDEQVVTEINYQKMCANAALGNDIIIADTNLNPKTRNKLIRQCQELGYEVEIKEFPISFPEALRRDKERGIFSVGEEVLKKQWEMWVTYHMEKLEDE